MYPGYPYAPDIPNVRNFQTEPEMIDTSIEQLSKKVTDIKKSVEAFWPHLEMQEKCQWPEMVQQFSTLMSDFSLVQNSIMKSGLSSGAVDYGKFLRSHVLVPIQMQYESDPKLEEITDYRVSSFNHELAPELLRTKNNPEMEMEEAYVDVELVQSGEQAETDKYIKDYNDAIDGILAKLGETDKPSSSFFSEKPDNKEDETEKLVFAIMNGEGIQPNRRPPPPPQANPTQD